MLTEKHSQGTIFGYEWVNDGQFGKRVDSYESLQACSHKDTTCLAEWNLISEEPYSYVYLWNRNDPGDMALYAYLDHNSAFELVYKNERNAVFRH